MVSIVQAVQSSTGIYTIPEAALYARLHTGTLKRWLLGAEKSEKVTRVAPEICSGEFVSFLEFVQSLAIKAIRTEHKISLQKIRDAVRVAQDEYHVEYPLARKHTTYLWGSEILIQVDSDKDPIQVTGKHKRQMTMKRIVEIYLSDLSWDAEGLASEYRPFDIGILLNPKKRFGEPIVESCGISAIALWEAVQSEGSIHAAADAYGVTPNEVRVASHYFDILEGRPAK